MTRKPNTYSYDPRTALRTADDRKAGLSWKVQEKGPSGKWIAGRIHATRAAATDDLATRRGPCRIKTIRS